MKDRNMKENKFDIFHVLLQTYGFKEKIGFIFNSFQSVLSQLVLGGISWYIFDVLFKNDGNIYISIIFLLFVTIYFIFFIPLWGYFMELGQSKFKKNLSNTIIRSYFQSNPMEVAPLHSSYFIDILQSDVGKTSEFGSWRTVVFVQALMSGVIAASSFALINWKILIILLSIGAVPLLFDITYAKKIAL